MLYNYVYLYQFLYDRDQKGSNRMNAKLEAYAHVALKPWSDVELYGCTWNSHRGHLSLKFIKSIHACTHIRQSAQALTVTNWYMYTRTCTRTHENIHADRRTLSQAHIHIHTHMLCHAYTHKLMDARSNMFKQACAETRITRGHTFRFTRTHSNDLGPSCYRPNMCLFWWNNTRGIKTPCTRLMRETIEALLLGSVALRLYHKMQRKKTTEPIWNCCI